MIFKIPQKKMQCNAKNKKKRDIILSRNLKEGRIVEVLTARDVES